LPGGIFNRSFIRAYAKFVGYDEDKAIEEYGNTMREHGQSEDEPPKQRSMVYTDDGGGRSPMKTLFLAIVILALLSLAVWGGLYFYQKRAAGQNRGATPPTDTQMKEEQHGVNV
jgi:cytoskeletal protein RodZ